MFMIQFERLYEFHVISDITQQFELLVDSIKNLLNQHKKTFVHDEENSLIEMKNME